MKILRITLTYGDIEYDDVGTRTLRPQIMRSHEISALTGDLLDLDDKQLLCAAHNAYGVIKRTARAMAA